MGYLEEMGKESAMVRTMIRRKFRKEKNRFNFEVPLKVKKNKVQHIDVVVMRTKQHFRSKVTVGLGKRS